MPVWILLLFSSNSFNDGFENCKCWDVSLFFPFPFFFLILLCLHFNLVILLPLGCLTFHSTSVIKLSFEKFEFFFSWSEFEAIEVGSWCGFDKNLFPQWFFYGLCWLLSLSLSFCFLHLSHSFYWWCLFSLERKK